MNLYSTTAKGDTSPPGGRLPSKSAGTAPPTLALAILVFLLCTCRGWACGLNVADYDSHTVSDTETYDCVTVGVGAHLYIPASATLVLSGDPNNVSTIGHRGMILLQGSSSRLRITNKDHTFIGSGTIEGGDSAARIDLASGRTLTLGSNVTIEGALVIGPYSSAQNTTFVNNGLVIANAAGKTLCVSTSKVHDAAGGTHWKVGNATATLQFTTSATGSNRLVGNIQVEAGTLDLHANVTTSGTVEIEAGAKITVQKGKTFQAV